MFRGIFEKITDGPETDETAEALADVLAMPLGKATLRLLQLLALSTAVLQQSYSIINLALSYHHTHSYNVLHVKSLRGSGVFCSLQKARIETKMDVAEL